MPSAAKEGRKKRHKTEKKSIRGILRGIAGLQEKEKKSRRIKEELASPGTIESKTCVEREDGTVSTFSKV